MDHIYMTVCQMMTGKGGWPLTLFLHRKASRSSPELTFQKKARLVLPELPDLLPRITRSWQERKIDLITSSEGIAVALHQERAILRRCKFPIFHFFIRVLKNWNCDSMQSTKGLGGRTRISCPAYTPFPDAVLEADG